MRVLLMSTLLMIHRRQRTLTNRLMRILALMYLRTISRLNRSILLSSMYILPTRAFPAGLIRSLPLLLPMTAIALPPQLSTM